MKTTIRTITPENAAHMLKMNTANRNPNTHHVAFLAKQMAAGEWVVNGQSVVISDDGRLLDGQHRLLACVKAHHEFTTVVCTGVSSDAMETIDTGKPRSAGDVLALNGVAQPAAKAAMVSLVFSWINNTTHLGGGANSGATKATNSDVLKLYRADEHLIDQCVKLSANKGLKFMAGAQVAFVFYILSSVHDFSEIERFVGFCTNGGDYAKSPTHTLPMFIRDRKEKGISTHRKENIYLLLHAFEKWAAMEPLSVYKAKSILNGAAKVYKRYPLDETIYGTEV